MGSGVQDQRRRKLQSLRIDGELHGASKGTPGSPPGSETEFMGTWSSDCLRNFVKKTPHKAQHPKIVRFSELTRAEDNDGRRGDFIRFPFCWNPQGVGEERGREEGLYFILPIVTKLGNP